MTTVSPTPDEYTESSLATQAGFMDQFYNALFYPVSTFKTIGSLEKPGNGLLFQALMAVVLVSGIAPIVQLINVGGQPGDLVFAIPTGVIIGVAAWGFMGLVIALASYAFTGESRIKTFLTLSGFATLPWLLMGSTSLFKIGLGPFGVALSVIGALLIWLWSVLLFALALMVTYRMTLERVMLVLAAPFVTMIILLAWIIGFIDNVRQLVPHS